MFTISGSLENDYEVPELVDSPDSEDEEDNLEKRMGKISGAYSWENEPCPQSNFTMQANRWMKCIESWSNIFDAIQTILHAPFLFQRRLIPEKWIRWASVKDLIDYDFEARILPDGAITREHYLATRLMESGMRKVKQLAERKKTVVAIMKMMYSIRNVPSTEVDRALKETRQNDLIKTVVAFIKAEANNFSDIDQEYVQVSDRLCLAALLCFRQFAEAVHIIACEARDIASEVDSHFSLKFYHFSEIPEEGRKKGNELYKAGKYQEAIKVYTAAINKAPFHYLLYSNRCQAAIQCRNYQSAFIDAYRSLLLNPEWTKCYYKIAICSTEMGDLGEAIGWGRAGLLKCLRIGDTVVSDKINELLKNIEEAKAKLFEVVGGEENLKTFVCREKTKKPMKKRKKIQKNKIDKDAVPALVSDEEFDEGASVSAKTKKEERKKLQEQRRKQQLLREKKDQREREIQQEFESYVEKASQYFLKDCFRDACKSYSLALDLVEQHKEIRGCYESDVATLLYSHGMSSQQQGTPTDIDVSRKYFGRIISEHKSYSHICMVNFSNAKSTFLLNDFDIAFKHVSETLEMLNKFPVRGLLSWPGTTEYIYESNEKNLRKEIHILLQQCKVPPRPAAICQYEECLKDYRRKEVYVTDLDFEGYFIISCDWSCVIHYHLRCWSKFKHEILRVSGDRDVLGTPCRTPDCLGKIIFIQMLDEKAQVKRDLKLPHERKKNETKFKGTKYDHRTMKSEFNLKKYNEMQIVKKKKKRARLIPTEADIRNIKQSTRIKYQNRFPNVHIPADKDLSEATVYVKTTGADNSQKVQAPRIRGRNNKRMGPVSLQHFCSSLPGYRRHMPMEEIIEAIDRAKVDCTSFILPDDLREEIEQYEHSLSNVEPVQFTDDEKMKMPFLFEYFRDFFSVKGPLDTNDELFSSQLILLPQDMKQIVIKCGGLLAFLNSSPLFIQIPPYIGVHSQHTQLKRLTGDYPSDLHDKNSRSSSVDHDFIPDFDNGLSRFAQEFYHVGAPAEDSDIINLIGGTDSAGNMYKLDDANENVPSQKKASQNSETSSMYSLDDLADPQSEAGSQASTEMEKQVFAMKNSQRQTTRHVSQPKETKNVGSGHAGTSKKQKKKFTVQTTESGTQTEGKDEAEKAKEAVARLLERLEELQDNFTKLKITSQTREESLLKKVEEAGERERIAIQGKQSMKQYVESEMSKISSLRKQTQDKIHAAEAKMEQSQAREREAQMNLSSLTQGMQRDRETHLREIIELRNRVENKEKDGNESRRRAVKAELDLMRTKEAYHVSAHMQARAHCEQVVKEYDMEIARLSTTLPEHVLQHFRLAKKQWAANVVTCDKTIETLKAAYASILDQIGLGKPLSELPSVPDLKPPAPGPNPRQMMMQLQRNNMMNKSRSNGSMNGGGDGQPGTSSHQPGATGVNGNGFSNGVMNSLIGSSAYGMPSYSSPIHSISTLNKSPLQASVSSPAPLAPIGSEITTKAPKRNNFQMLIDKLTKSIPQLTRQQIERCTQQVRADNKGLTGLLYEEIEQRIRIMTGLSNIGEPVPTASSSSSSSTLSPPSNASALPMTWNMASIQPGFPKKNENYNMLDLEEEDSMCPICCDPLKDGKISTLDCQHRFHYACINKWMQKQRTCPNCRKFMADTAEFPALGQTPLQIPPGLLPS